MVDICHLHDNFIMDKTMTYAEDYFILIMRIMKMEPFSKKVNDRKSLTVFHEKAQFQIGWTFNTYPGAPI